MKRRNLFKLFSLLPFASPAILSTIKEVGEEPTMPDEMLEHTFVSTEYKQPFRALDNLWGNPDELFLHTEDLECLETNKLSTLLYYPAINSMSFYSCFLTFNVYVNHMLLLDGYDVIGNKVILRPHLIGYDIEPEDKIKVVYNVSHRDLTLLEDDKLRMKGYERDFLIKHKAEGYLKGTYTGPFGHKVSITAIETPDKKMTASFHQHQDEIQGFPSDLFTTVLEYVSGKDHTF